MPEHMHIFKGINLIISVIYIFDFAGFYKSVIFQLALIICQTLTNDVMFRSCKILH